MSSRAIVGLVLVLGINQSLLADDPIEASAPPETMTAKSAEMPTTQPDVVPAPTDTVAPAPAPEPATTQNTMQAAPPPTAPQETATPTTASTTTSTTSPTQAINCNYQLDAQQTTIDNGLLLKWTSNAVEQAFTFDSAQLNSQLEQLKACFTVQGWQSFYEALKSSGNLNSVTTQQLTVSAMADGQGNVTQNKPNEWKVMIPLQVVYQNKQQKITQLLNVDALVGRKPTGALGIMQVVATPREGATADASSVSTPAPAAPAAPAAAAPTPVTTPAAAVPAAPATPPAGGTVQPKAMKTMPAPAN